MELKEDLKGWQVVLASASPRRKELLEQIGICPQICPSNAEEKKDETDPQKLVEKLSSVKAEDVAGCFPAGTLVIGADTVVSIVKDGESDPVILGKPGTVEKAEEMISLIQGRTHQVYTGVTVILCLGADRFAETTFAEKTDVEVYEMAEDEIRAYAASGEPLDKAGAYGIQGSFAAYIKGIKGDYSNVVGLPLGRLKAQFTRCRFYSCQGLIGSPSAFFCNEEDYVASVINFKSCLFTGDLRKIVYRVGKVTIIDSQFYGFGNDYFMVNNIFNKIDKLTLTNCKCENTDYILADNITNLEIEETEFLSCSGISKNIKKLC